MKKFSVFLLNLPILFALGFYFFADSGKMGINNKSAKIESPPVKSTYFGALIADQKDTSSVDFKIATLKNLDAEYTRWTIVIENWNGRNFTFEKYEDNGIHQLLNINNQEISGKNPPPFVKDTVTYKIELEDILSKYSPAVVVVENEEGNFEYHTGSMQDYINQLRAATTVIKAHNLKGTNGGLSKKPLSFLVYRYYFNRGEFDKATDFGDRCIDEKYIYNLAHPGNSASFEESISKWDSLIQAYRTIPIDYVNIHYYEPFKYRNVKGAADSSKDIKTITPGALQEITDYIYNVTGKKTISNEMGMLNSQPDLVTNMMNECINVHMDYCIWFSGDWPLDGAVALHNADGTPDPCGKAFRDFIISHPH